MNFITKEKPYNTLTAYNLYKYNSKVAKIALNADFTCPNKDGKKGYGGCSYCSKLGSGDFAGNKEKPLKEQFEDIRKILEQKWPNIKYMPYLQANSNTYASLDHLKKIYDEVIKLGTNVKMASNFLMGEVTAYLKENKLTINETKLTPGMLKDLIELIENKTITNNIAKSLIIKLFLYV